MLYCSEYTSKNDSRQLKSQLQHLEPAIQEHVELTKRQLDEALKRKEKLQEELEDEEDRGAQRKLGIIEIEIQQMALNASSKLLGELLQKVQETAARAAAGCLNHSV